LGSAASIFYLQMGYLFGQVEGHLDPLKGMPIFNSILRLLGAQVGSDVCYLGSICMPPEMLTVEARAVIGPETDFIAHSFEDRRFKMEPIRVEINCSLGERSSLMGYSHARAASRLLPLTQGMKGATFAPGRMYGGNPADTVWEESVHPSSHPLSAESVRGAGATFGGIKPEDTDTELGLRQEKAEVGSKQGLTGAQQWSRSQCLCLILVGLVVVLGTGGAVGIFVILHGNSTGTQPMSSWRLASTSTTVASVVAAASTAAATSAASQADVTSAATVSVAAEKREVAAMRASSAGNGSSSWWNITAEVASSNTSWESNAGSAAAMDPPAGNGSSFGRNIKTVVASSNVSWERKGAEQSRQSHKRHLQSSLSPPTTNQ